MAEAAARAPPRRPPRPPPRRPAARQPPRRPAAKQPPRRPAAKPRTAEETGGEGAGGTAGQGGDLILLQWQAPSQANPLLSIGYQGPARRFARQRAARRVRPRRLDRPGARRRDPDEGNGISDDLTQITWTLRDDIVWSDGTPFTSADVVFTYEYCTNEETGCSNETFGDVASVVADDDYTVTITFDAPKPYPFVPFVGYTSPVIQAAQFADCVGAAAKSCSEQNFAPIGTGPYMVTELRPEDTVTYVMNPNYRGAADGQPFFGNVTIKGGGDAEAAARSVLEVGDADYGWNLQVAPEILSGMEAAGNGRLASALRLERRAHQPEPDRPVRRSAVRGHAEPAVRRQPRSAQGALDRDQP